MSPLTTIQHCEEQSMYLNGVKVGVIASSMDGRGFKPITIKLIFAVSPPNTQH
jgi:hypothetical protein